MRTTAATRGQTADAYPRGHAPVSTIKDAATSLQLIRIAGWYFWYTLSCIMPQMR